MSEKINFEITEDENRQRLDKFLSEKLAEYSRGQIQQAIEKAAILCNGQAVKNKYLLNIGDVITGYISKPQALVDKPQDIALNIIYQDAEIAITNKPVGIVTHPAAGNPDGTLLNALLNAFPENANLPRAGIIHRLDKDTSGLLVVAKTLQAQTALVRQLQERSMGREYFALVYGEVTAGGTIDAAIGRSPHNRLKMAIRPDGKPAITHYRISERFDNFTLLQVKLETGRTHQIRVHLSENKMPLVGDQVYKSVIRLRNCSSKIREAVDNFSHQALHAAKLSLIHPKTNEEINFSAPLPDDFSTLLDVLRGE
ncbi:MAG: RluA family pseudouridine synthase [Cardiobacteriaceae bacterium]|nr:RluA family pseudouridine synthase [Cardiobacteriaceae bacterium]